MAELKIDVTKLVGRCCEMVMDETEYAGKTLRKWIDDITNGDYVPASKTELVKHGTWRKGENFGGEFCDCSVCNVRHYNVSFWKYCPNCGAKMDGGMKK